MRTVVPPDEGVRVVVPTTVIIFYFLFLYYLIILVSSCLSKHAIHMYFSQAIHPHQD